MTEGRDIFSSEVGVALKQVSKCEEGTASWSPARFGLPGTLAGEGREKKKLLDAPERRSGGVREPRRQSSGVSRRVASRQ